MAEYGIEAETPCKKLEYIDLLAEDIKVAKAIFRLFCRMSSARPPRVVTPVQEGEFYERMIRIDNNFKHWRDAYLSKNNIPTD